MMDERFFDAILGNKLLLGLALLVARIWMAVLFLTFGINKLIHTGAMQEYMQLHNGSVPVGLIYLAILVQIACGGCVALGYHTRFNALMLAGFCIIATSLFHTNFAMEGELTNFLKDFAIAGGFLFMIAFGPGPLSLDARFRRVKQREAMGEPSAAVR